MRRSLRFLIITGIACTLSATALASTKQTARQEAEIQGNPIGKRDNFTVNSQSQGSANVQCTFTNTGNVPAELKIWTAPKGKNPTASIRLDAAKNKQPVTIKKEFKLDLVRKWWCRIFTPHKDRKFKDKKNWPYCAYFSISDATISTVKGPFATWDSTTRSKDTHYQCVIVDKKAKPIRFFFFK